MRYANVHFFPDKPEQSLQKLLLLLLLFGRGLNPFVYWENAA
jgi:hypothetical protein